MACPAPGPDEVCLPASKDLPLLQAESIIAHARFARTDVYLHLSSLSDAPAHGPRGLAGGDRVCDCQQLRADPSTSTTTRHLPMVVASQRLAIFLAAEMLLKFPAGHLSDRYGRRHFAAIGLVVCIGTPLAIWLVPPALFIAAPVHVVCVLVPLRFTDGAGSAACGLLSSPLCRTTSRAARAGAWQ